MATVIHHGELTEREIEILQRQTTLEDVLRWGFSLPESQRCRQVIADFVVHDEFSHDVLVPWRDGLWLVYQAT